MKLNMNTSRLLTCLATTALVSACAEGKGSLSVILDTEDLVTNGLQPGTDGENIQDGWTVTFDKYLVGVGDIDVKISDGHDDHGDHGDHGDHDDHDDHGGHDDHDDHAKEAAEAAEVYVVDLTKIGAGVALWQLDNLLEGSWSFNYKTKGAADGATRHESAVQADFDKMVAEDWTYMIDGTMTKADGQSCPPAALTSSTTKMPNGKTSGTNDCYDAPSVKFVFGAPAETDFGPCEIDEKPGFSITADQTQTVAATIHGDHPFFNGFPEGDEGGVKRLAQWIADCDLDLDGIVTIDELKKIKPSDLPELDSRYQLGGSPINPLNNMYDYLRAQLKTQGHYQGEGECPADGVGHMH